PLADFKSWVVQSSNQPRILFSPAAPQTLAGWARRQAPRAVTLMIGPEGGFSADEEEVAVANGAVLLSLGERVLRTETAGIVASAALSTIWSGG
ncbi:MAG: RsmE family RNA methyltransferase, partial [Burkholderiaceae bacterium]|nr:RsmE family RNA methyltransferase [Burkholderiaceae bacterium]